MPWKAAFSIISSVPCLSLPCHLWFLFWPVCFLFLTMFHSSSVYLLCVHNYLLWALPLCTPALTRAHSAFLWGLGEGGSAPSSPSSDVCLLACCPAVVCACVCVYIRYMYKGIKPELRALPLAAVCKTPFLWLVCFQWGKRTFTPSSASYFIALDGSVLLCNYGINGSQSPFYHFHMSWHGRLSTVH